MDFDNDPSGSRLMVEVERAVILDPEDALEERLRLGVLTSALLEHADVLCTDVAVQQLPGATAVLEGWMRDASTLAAAMDVLARRSRGSSPGSSTSES